MTKTQLATVTPKPRIEWAKLPPDFILPDDPVENIYQPLLAAALREILDLAGFVAPDMLMGSNFGLCALVEGEVVVKAPDWFYIPGVLPVEPGVIRRSYTPHLEGDIPALVMEFLSGTDNDENSSKSTFPYGKWYFYERILKVPIYVIFDPYEDILKVYYLKSGKYEGQKPDENGRYWIDSMNLYLGIWRGKRSNLTISWLRWWDEAGNMLPWADEKVQQSLQEGIEQGKVDLITRLLTRQFGQIESEIQGALNGLSASDLDELGDVFLDFANLEALSSWLAQRQK